MILLIGTNKMSKTCSHTGSPSYNICPPYHCRVPFVIVKSLTVDSVLSLLSLPSLNLSDWMVSLFKC